ncbi:MAG: S41 family peptidase [Cytophagales bacterium]|nr:S41 family peptidase [Cytophagales bacterium]
MSSMKQFIATIYLVGSASLAFSQVEDRSQDPNRQFSAEKLKLDLYQLRTALENVHPGLYRFETKEIWDARFDSLSNALDEPLTGIEFYRILVPFISKVRCGHTNIGVSTIYNQHVFAESKNFPFMVRVVDGKLYTYHNLSDENNIPDGSQLLSINHQPYEDIIKMFYNAVRADGFIETARYRKLGKYFSYFYATLIGYPDSFNLRYIAPGEKMEKEATVMAKQDLQKASLHWERYDSKLPPTELMKSPLGFLINRNEDYAILKVDRFFTKGDEPKDLYERAFDSLFTEISKRNITNLIIDLRGNGGGIDDLTSLLYSYLVDKPFKWYRQMRVKNLNYDSYTKAYTYNEYQYAQDEAGDIWVTNGDELFMNQKVSSPSFNGNVFVLVDGLTFSAGSILAAYIKSSGRGIIIGEESGGYSNGVTGGRSVSFQLKHTGISFSIPPLQTFFELETPNSDQGVIPDYHVKTTILDLVKGNDSVMDFAIQSIQND